MIDDFDEALRKLLVRELPVKKNEIDIDFHQPKREWSARLSRPTLNLFLYDIRENVKLRQAAHHWVPDHADEKAAAMRRLPVRVELHYVITAWATEPEDEHRLLGRSLLALFRCPMFPDDLLPESLRPQPAPITIEVAQRDGLQNPSDFWSAMDNEIRPALVSTISLALDPYRPMTTPLVREYELRFIQAGTGESESFSHRVLWGVNGWLRGAPPMRPIRMVLVERELDIPVEHDGAFTIRGIPAGEYTLEISVSGGPPTHRKLTVPSRDYTIEWQEGTDGRKEA
jgi:hypothetical protein